MEIREARGPNANLSVNGNLHQALSKERPAPRLDIAKEGEPSPVVKHRDFPE